MPKTKSPIIWVSTTDMAKELGIDPRTLRRYIPNLTQGTHFYVVNDHCDRKTYRWHRQRMLKHLKIN